MESVVNLISEQRLKIYQEYFNSGNEAESLGLYLWNQSVCSEFHSIIQIIEISLRNAIFEGHKEIDDNEKWFIDYFLALDDQNEGKKQINYALSQASRKANHTTDDVISNLTFGFWASLCADYHNEDNSASLKLWPKLKDFAFKNAEGVDHTQIFDLIKKVKKIRNRISHHEVIWKDPNGVGITSIANRVIRSYGDCLKLVSLINNENSKLIHIMEGHTNIIRLCSEDEINRYKNIISEWKSLPNIDVDEFLTQNLKEGEVSGFVSSIAPKNIYIKSEQLTDYKSVYLKFKVDNEEKSALSEILCRNDSVIFKPFVIRKDSGNIYIAKSVRKMQ